MLIASLRRNPRNAVWLIVWSCVQALPSVASGWVVAEATAAFLAGHPAKGTEWLGVLAVAAVVGAFGTRQSYLRLGAIVEPLRDDLVELIVRGALAHSTQPGKAPDTGAVGRMTHQAEIVRDCYAGVLMVAFMFVCTAGSSLAGLITLVPAALPYVIPPMLVALLILRLMLRPFAVRQRRSVIGEETVAGVAAKAVSGLRDVTACGAEDPVLGELTAVIERQAAASRSVARISAARLIFITAGGWLPLVLVLVAAPSLLHGGLSPAHLIGAIAYISGTLRATLYTFSQGVGASMVRLTVTLERIVEASTVEPADEAPSVAGIQRARFGDIKLKDVAFSYGQHAEPVLRDLSLDIAPGDHLAIVGPSGVGKSSLAGLLAGMLRPTDGEILLDGEAAPLQPGERVLIPQEAYVFAGTLAENIRYLRDADDQPSVAELDAAAEAVGLSPLVTRLGGYQAMVSPSALSAGERQLIALVRAYVSTAPIAILDEATCHLDPAAEARAEEAFTRRPGTLIVIAHRISSAMRARRILVLDGSTARCGDHDSLLADSAMYRDLVGYWTTDSITSGKR
jgi:ATP-binding cassette subfamily C protein